LTDPRHPAQSGAHPDATRSRIATSNERRIEVRGLDLTHDLIGKVDLGAMAFLELRGRLPDERESRMFNALLVTLVEHGLTPSALVTRLTYFGAPDSIQGAVAAGLLGLGSTFVGTIEGSARLLQDALGPFPGLDADLNALASAIVVDHQQRRAAIPGLGHPLHKDGDPRTAALFGLAAELGFAGRYVGLEERIGAQASARFGRALPVNATGAIGAIVSEMEFPWSITRGFGVMSRAIGLVAHILEEREAPIAGELWRDAESKHQ
jgi:citrate synthase